MPTETTPYTVAGFEVPLRPMQNTDSSKWRNYEGLKEGQTVLPKGWQRTESHRALPADIIFDRDVPVTMKDGVKIRVDVFRPKDGPEKLPAILMWSPYGKSGVGSFGLHMIEGQAGIPISALSGLEKFEGLDPAEFCPRGYAIVNADARGLYDSEGFMLWNGSDGKDCAEAVEWIASQPWCTGKVGMAGNSWLVQTMWHCAALKPKGLTALAPWEGFSDFYRETLCRGAYPYRFLEGRGMQEDPFAMLDKYPHVNAYWEDKRAKLEQIELPAYILASYSTGLHTAGSVRGFRELNTKDKWLRIHPTQEWHDLYQNYSVDDIAAFWDRFLKGEQNGWDTKTPKVRISLLRMNGDSIVNQPETDYPVPRTEYRKLSLLPGGKLSDAVGKEGKVDFDGRVQGEKGETTFEWTFGETTQLAGYAKAVLYMSTDKGVDFDVFVQLRKADKNGELLTQVNIPHRDLAEAGAPFPDEASVPFQNIFRHRGPKGVLRASHRAVSSTIGTSFDPFHTHTTEDAVLVKPGEVVKLEIGFWPMGIVFEEGEKVVLIVSGTDVCLPEFPGLSDKVWNQGNLTLHMGGEQSSYVQVPVI